MTEWPGGLPFSEVCHCRHGRDHGAGCYKWFAQLIGRHAESFEYQLQDKPGRSSRGSCTRGRPAKALNRSFWHRGHVYFFGNFSRKVLSSHSANFFRASSGKSSSSPLAVLLGGRGGPPAEAACVCGFRLQLESLITHKVQHKLAHDKGKKGWQRILLFLFFAFFLSRVQPFLLQSYSGLRLAVLCQS